MSVNEILDADLSTNFELLSIEDESAAVVKGGQDAFPFSKLPAYLKSYIFSFLKDSDARVAMGVSREWCFLNVAPLGQVQLRTMRVCDLVQHGLPKCYHATNYDELARTNQLPLLTNSSYKSRCSNTQPVSISENFLETDPITPPIARGIKMIQLELKADPFLNETIQKVIQIEKETEYTHSPFYHAMNRTVFMFGFSTKRLLATMNLTSDQKLAALNPEFEKTHWFRFAQSQSSEYPQTIADFPLGSISHPGFDDHVTPIKQWVLAANPSLFCNAWTNGEGTWDLFLENKSVHPPSEESYFNLLCDQFGLLPDPGVREKYAAQYASLLGAATSESSSWLRKGRTIDQRQLDYGTRGNRDLGVLFQILVPKPIVDDVAYPCREYGVPGDFMGKTMKQVHRDTKEDPHGSYYTQARMMSAALVNPKNEIVTNTYGASEYFKTPEGQAMCEGFDQFFMTILAESQVSKSPS